MLHNKKRAMEYMEKYDLEAIVATSPVNVSYFTDFNCWMYRGFRENMSVPGAPATMKQAYAVVASSGEVTLVADSFTAPFPHEARVKLSTYGNLSATVSGKRGQQPSYALALQRAVATQRPTPSEALTETLSNQGVRRGRVAVELSNLSEESRVRLRKNFSNVKFLDAPELIRFIRMIKTEEEVRRLKKAAEISERALNKSLSFARQGVKSGELLRAYVTEIASDAAIFEHFIFSFEGMGITDDETVTIRSGDYTSVDCGCVYRLYYSDTGTTVIFGRNPAVSRRHKKLWQVVEECVDSLRPGSTPSSILARFARAYEREGIRNVDYQGHGIGLETREHPVIAHGGHPRISDGVIDERTDMPLEAGMTINIETPVFDVGNGAYQVERTFLIGRRSNSEITPARDGSAFVTG